MKLLCLIRVARIALRTLLKNMVLNFHFVAFDGFGQQKYAAEQLCHHDWVLNLDGDEFITDELKDEIRTFLDDPSNLERYDGVRIKNQGHLSASCQAAIIWSLFSIYKAL